MGRGPGVEKGGVINQGKMNYPPKEKERGKKKWKRMKVGTQPPPFELGTGQTKKKNSGRSDNSKKCQKKKGQREPGTCAAAKTDKKKKAQGSLAKRRRGILEAKKGGNLKKSKRGEGNCKGPTFWGHVGKQKKNKKKVINQGQEGRCQETKPNKEGGNAAPHLSQNYGTVFFPRATQVRKLTEQTRWEAAHAH